MFKLVRKIPSKRIGVRLSNLCSDIHVSLHHKLIQFLVLQQHRVLHNLHISVWYPERPDLCQQELANFIHRLRACMKVSIVEKNTAKCWLYES